MGNKIIDGNIIPKENNNYFLGNADYIFDTIFCNYLEDGASNSVSVGQISNGIFNVINASDIVNNTLTDAQYNIITNGRPTLIKGTILSSYTNMWLMVGLIESSRYKARYFGTTAYPFLISGVLQIDASTKVISIPSTKDIRIDNLGNINNKTIPAYPSNTGDFALKQINGTLTWAQEWYGTQAEYDALSSYDSNTMYYILED